VDKHAVGSKSKVVCDALILDEDSRSDTYPYIKIEADDVDVGHEATVSKIGDEQLFYLMSRGLTEAEASAMIVSGFVEPIVKTSARVRGRDEPPDTAPEWKASAG
jgi:Fe-S cluster assembly protein SufB